jgi:hypothetical protein
VPANSSVAPTGNSWASTGKIHVSFCICWWEAP